MTTENAPEMLDGHSLDVADERRRELLRLFPEVRTEGGTLDFDKLKLALGEAVDVGRERYGMNWPGKAECFRTIQATSTATLRPVREESVDFDTTQNLIIEGDNLEVLKLLQKAYLGKVKMIYIDPPYNTGNDFIYPDNYAESLQTYLEFTGQVDAQGRKFSTNTETDGRFHSKWLNMMYPRLFLARNLLSFDGVVFISIDDHEITNLRRVCDEVFGEASYKGTVVRATGQTTGQDGGGLGLSFDYVVVYTKDPDAELSGLPLDENDLERYQAEDSRGKYALWQLRKTGSNDRRTDRPNMYFPIKDPDGNDVWPIGPTGYESCWRFDPKGYERLRSDDYIVWQRRRRGDTEEWWPYVKTYLEGRSKRPSPLWDDIEGSKKASIDLRELLGGNVFNNPKPVSLIKRLAQIAPAGAGPADFIVLDFFAGSGTTAQALFELTLEDGAPRACVLVQLPEKTEQSGFPTIADITKHRVKRSGSKLKEKSAGRLREADAPGVDFGFRVMKLADSNFGVWSSQSQTADEVAQQLALHVSHIRADRTDDDLLFEILLKSGYPPSEKIDALEVSGTTVASVAGGLMFVCLARTLTLDAVRAMADRAPERVVCLDVAFEGNDQLKANAVQIFKSKGIVFKTV